MSKNTKGLNSASHLQKNKIGDTELHRNIANIEHYFDRGVDFINRVIQITSDIDYPLFDIVDVALSIMEKDNPRSTVTIKIHSGGGSVYEALAVVGRIRASSCHIVTEGYGHIMSAATLILASGDNRKISRYAWFMHHETSYCSSGTLSQNREMLKQVEREERFWSKWMHEFTNYETENYWYKLGIKKDVYINAEELVEMGVARSIIKEKGRSDE